MNKFYSALVAIAAIALMIPASAQEVCYTTSAPELTIPGAGPNVGGDVYVDNDMCQPALGDGSCLFSIWGYEETNSIGGLQRDDEAHSDIPEGCDVAGDTIIF